MNCATSSLDTRLILTLSLSDRPSSLVALFNFRTVETTFPSTILTCSRSKFTLALRILKALLNSGEASMSMVNSPVTGVPTGQPSSRPAAI